jgi:hypothetical protein
MEQDDFINNLQRAVNIEIARMLEGDIYLPRWECTYILGDGSINKEGIFVERSRTANQLVLEMIEPGCFPMFKYETTRKFSLNNTRGSEFTPRVTSISDSEFTVYHLRGGTPFTYKKIEAGITSIPY